MIVQELLKYVDPKALADIRQSRIEDWEKDLYSPREVYMKHQEDFARMLQTLTPDPTLYKEDEGCGGFVMALMPYAIDTGGHIDIRYEAEYMRRGDFEKAVEAVRKAEAMPDIDLNNSSADEMESFLKNTADLLPQGFAYEFTPWEKVLAAELLPGAFEAVEGLDEESCRNLFLFSLLWELSFNGYTREDQQGRMDKLDKSIKEMDELDKLPEEERSKHFIDADEVFREICEKNGLEYHEDTEEEKEANRIRFLKEYCITRSLRLKGMWKLAEAYEKSDPVTMSIGE